VFVLHETIVGGGIRRAFDSPRAIEEIASVEIDRFNPQACRRRIQEDASSKRIGAAQNGRASAISIGVT
jgi:hypothetical protein